jgi:hypothetical protein
MIRVIALRNTDRVGGTTRDAASADLQTKEAVFDFTGGRFIGVPEILHLVDLPNRLTNVERS